MRRWFAWLLVLFSLWAPRTARAQTGEGFLLAGVLFVGAGAVGVANVVGGIGSSVDLARSPPSRGWALVSLISGALAAAIATELIITAAVFAGSGQGADGTFFAEIAAAPLVISSYNLI